jgi:hypothetical protein
MAKYEIKTVVTGADQSAKEFQKLEEQMGKTGIETEKLTNKKSALLSGIKKLGHEIPVVGYALSALKNPFTAIGIVAALATKAVYDYVEAVDKMADSIRAVTSLQGRVTKFFEVMAEQKAGADAFAEKLNAIKTAAQGAAEWLKVVNGEIDRRFNKQDADAEKAGTDTPEAKAIRNREKISARAAALDNAARQSLEASQAAQAKLPGARAAAGAAGSDLKVLTERAHAEDSDDAAAEAALLLEEKKLRDQAGGYGHGIIGSIARGMAGGPAAERTAMENANQWLADNIRQRNIIAARRSLRGADLVRAQERAKSAAGQVTTLEGQATGGLESARASSLEAGILHADVNSQLPPNPGLGPGSLQFRYEAQRGALRNANVVQGADDLAAALSAILKRVTQRIENLERREGVTNQNIR